MARNSSVAGFLQIEPMVNGLNTPTAKLSLSEESCQHPEIPGVGIMRCDQIERKDLDIAR